MAARIPWFRASWITALASLLAVAPGWVFAEDDASIYGTHRVSYERLQSYGLEGCLLKFMAVAPERAERNAKPVAIYGHIVANRKQEADSVPILGLKIAIQDVVANAKRMPHARPT